MNFNYNIIQKLIGLQGVEVTYSNVNNGTFEVFATSIFDFAVCPHCGHITYSVLECLPNAKPVIDRFHIAQHLHNCVDEAGKHIQNHIRKYGKKDEVFKIRWFILKNIEDLNSEEYNNLLTAFAKYEKLEELHYLKEEFRIFFDITTNEDAASFLDYYKGLVSDYGIPELKKFVQTIDNWMPYILNYYDYPISNGTVEGNNHKVKNIKRRAYGYRNRYNYEIRVKYEFKCA